MQPLILSIIHSYKSILGLISTITLGYIGLETAQHIYYAFGCLAAIFTIANVVSGWVSNYFKKRKK